MVELSLLLINDTINVIYYQRTMSHFMISKMRRESGWEEVQKGFDL